MVLVVCACGKRSDTNGEMVEVVVCVRDGARRCAGLRWRCDREVKELKEIDGWTNDVHLLLELVCTASF